MAFLRRITPNDCRCLIRHLRRGSKQRCDLVFRNTQDVLRQDERLALRHAYVGKLGVSRVARRCVGRRLTRRLKRPPRVGASRYSEGNKRYHAQTCGKSVRVHLPSNQQSQESRRFDLVHKQTRYCFELPVARHAYKITQVVPVLISRTLTVRVISHYRFRAGRRTGVKMNCRLGFQIVWVGILPDGAPLHAFLTSGSGALFGS